jgi:spore germination cell wall hydrolase CwlJ-like protein
MSQNIATPNERRNNMEKSLRLIAYLVGFLAVALTVQSLTVSKFETLRVKNGLYSQDVVSIKTRENELQCLALNIYREAGHEPFEGKVAVAQVTLNRVEHEKFPKKVCDVVYQKTVFTEKVVCQFSWYCDSVHRNRPVNKKAYEESYQVAKKVLLEGFRLDILEDALYYHATYVNPRWKLEKIGTIGQHIFYKEPQKGNRYASL